MQRLRFGSAETAAGIQHLALDVRDLRPRADFVDDFAEFLRLFQPRQRTRGPRNVRISSMSTHRAHQIDHLPRVLVLHEGEPRGLIEILNDTLTPAIRTSIVNGTYSHALPAR